MFNLFSKKPVLVMEVLFAEETNEWGTHGEIFATNIERKIIKKPIRFCFKGMNSAPPLTPEILDYIFKSAQYQGYIPYELISYRHHQLNEITDGEK